MNKIEKLIQEFCPDGVEYKELKQVATISNGKDHKHLENGKIPVYGSGGIMRHASMFIYNKESVLIPRKGSIGNIFYVDIPFWAVDTIFYTKINSGSILPKFLYYYLLTLDLTKLNFAGGVPSLTKSILDKILIPIPPLPVQQEIVNILDKFTQLEQELNAELETRRKQYDFYLNHLMGFEGSEVEWKTLGEIAEFKYGFTDKAKDKGNVRFVRITDINEYGKLRDNDYKYIDLTAENEEYILSKGDLLMARTGATFGKAMLFNENYPAVYASFLIRIRFIGEIILPDYYWHFSQSSLYWNQAYELVGGGAQPQFNANALKAVKIPIPPLSEQESIVSILDKFDSLVNDTTIGIPAEIEARRKQYAYYRNKLLTFGEYA